MNVETRKLIWGFAVVIGIILLNIVTFKMQEKPMIEKVTKSVIHNLQREYVPGPYSPGFDPDKVDPRIR